MSVFYFDHHLFTRPFHVVTAAARRRDVVVRVWRRPAGVHVVGNAVQSVGDMYALKLYDAKTMRCLPYGRQRLLGWQYMQAVEAYGAGTLDFDLYLLTRFPVQAYKKL